jgi:hypothetical protein
MPDFGNPHALPIGYFITKNTVAKAGMLSGKGRYNWLKDIQSVYPTELIPDWIMSNYFYKEMSPVLRWALFPFLLLSGLTFFVLGGAALEYFNITNDNIFLNNRIFDSIGVVGNLFQIILSINAIALLVFLALTIPFSFIIRDLKRTLKRFDIEFDPAELTGEKECLYIDAAKNIFNKNSETVAFIYGHTHKPSLQEIEGRYVINTGTWLKQFHIIKPRFGLFPSIYAPFYCLNYFKIKEVNDAIIIEYVKVDKSLKFDLTLIQRLLASQIQSEEIIEIPGRTTI